MGNYLIKLGSKTSKDGFKNEKEIAFKFNNWNQDSEAKIWLELMGYEIKEIEYVKAVILNGYKADLNVQIQIKCSSCPKNRFKSKMDFKKYKFCYKLLF